MSASSSVTGNVPVSSIVKICGVQDVESALVAAKAGAGLIGMIFVPKSKRCITAERGLEIATALESFANENEAKELSNKRAKLSQPQSSMSGDTDITASFTRHWFRQEAERLEERIRNSKRPLTVGVFMNQPLEDVNRLAIAAQLDLIQLHGSEGFEASQFLCRPVLRVMHIAPDSTAEKILAELKPGYASAILLDTKVKDSSGGLGVSFDWKVAQDLSQHIPVMVAGGLTPANVSTAIATVNSSSTQARPWQPGQTWAVDVSSGTETDGVKDHNKIKAFVAHALNGENA